MRLDAPAAAYPSAGIRWLISMSAGPAPAGLGRGGELSAGPAGGWAARGKQGEPP